MKNFLRLLWLTCCCARLASAQPATSFATPPAALTGEQILAKSTQAYLALGIYRGDCRVTSQVTMSIKGAPPQTVARKAQARFDFQRDDHFNIEGLDTEGGPYSITSRGAKTTLTMHLGGKIQVQKLEDLEAAVATMTGVGGRAPTTIPALLTGGNWGFPFLPDSSTRLNGRQSYAGHDCFLISQTTKATDSVSMFWIDSQSFLLRQMREKQGEVKFSTAQMKRMPQMAAFKILGSESTHMFSIEEAGAGAWWQIFSNAAL